MYDVNTDTIVLTQLCSVSISYFVKIIVSCGKEKAIVLKESSTQPWLTPNIL